MSKKRKVLTWIFGTFFALIALGTFFVVRKASDLIVKPAQKWNWNSGNYAQELRQTTFEVVSEDGIPLKGWATHPVGDSDLPVVVLIHGIGNNKNYWNRTAEWLFENGIPAVAFDGRAHGESGGEYCTFGFREKKDVQAVVAWAKNEFPGRKIGLWGHSLGGAVTLQSLEYDSTLAFGIVTSTFARLTEVVQDYQTRYTLGISLPTLTSAALERGASEAGFDAALICPELSAEHIHQPVFYAHGSEDDRIAISNAYRIYERLASTDKQLYVVPEADHHNLFYKGGDAYRAALLSFLFCQKTEKK